MTGREIDLAHAAAMPAPQGGALPTGLEWEALDRMAHTLADSSLIPYKMRGKPGDVAVVLLAAREYGVPPLMALSKLPVVNGTPAPMGELMVALVLRAGHRITSTVYNEDGTLYAGGPITPGTYAACVTRRRDEDDDQELRFTVQEALTAGLVDRIADGRTVARVMKTKNGQQVEERTPWEQYPANMLRWRAVANACRLRFPDVLMGLSYLPEELGATVDEDGYPVETIRVAASAPIEERTAVEWLDKLDEQPWPDEVLDNVLKAAENGGFIDTPVKRGEATTTVREAVGAHIAARADVVEGKVNEAPAVVPADKLDEQVTEWLTNLAAQTYDNAFLENILAQAVEAGFADHSIAGTGPSIRSTVGQLIQANNDGNPGTGTGAPPAEPETPPAPPEAETPAEGPPAAQEPAQGPPGLTAEDLAIVALEESDTDVLRQAWEDAKAADLLNADVLGFLTDTDRETLGVPPDAGSGPLGGLLQQVNRYVSKWGKAVRGVEPSASAEGWGQDDQLSPGEEPPPGWM